MQDFFRVSQVLYRWIRLKQSGKSIENLILRRGYRNLAIYSFTEIARCLIYELDGSQVNVKYIIDQQGNNLQINMQACTLSEAIDKDIDAVICCYLDNDITKDEIKKHFLCDVITVEELVYEL